MNGETLNRKPDGTGATVLLRTRFARCGCDVDAYGDDMIAEALVETCQPAAQWLSPEHVDAAFKRLTVTSPMARSAPAHDQKANRKAAERYATLGLVLVLAFAAASCVYFLF